MLLISYLNENLEAIKTRPGKRLSGPDCEIAPTDKPLDRDYRDNNNDLTNGVLEKFNS